MPRLFQRPHAYLLHKSTRQAVVSFFGDRVYLGPFGSRRSHQRYQEILKQWEAARHKQPSASTQANATVETPDAQSKVSAVTATTLREKRISGSPVTVSELILVYRRHTHEYYRKHGEVTREAGAIDDVLRILRKHHAMTYSADFGPLALDELRGAMIDELDWSRKYINKQVNRLRAMFKWASSKEIIDPSVSTALRELPGLKKGRIRAREIQKVTSVDDEVIDATLPYLPPMIADMVRIQRLTSPQSSVIFADDLKKRLETLGVLCGN